ncbi:MAG: hypothetical protein ACR2NX_14785 [Chthoniobacterales bacterium]
MWRAVYSTVARALRILESHRQHELFAVKRAFLFGLLCASAWALASSTARAASEARVTQVVRDVKLLPGNAKARPASLNDEVRDGVAVRTGD